MYTRAIQRSRGLSFRKPYSHTVYNGREPRVEPSESSSLISTGSDAVDDEDVLQRGNGCLWKRAWGAGEEGRGASARLSIVHAVVVRTAPAVGDSDSGGRNHRAAEVSANARSVSVARHFAASYIPQLRRLSHREREPYLALPRRHLA